jgi:alginate O-acetyltransferase complex protein AlgI
VGPETRPPVAERPPARIAPHRRYFPIPTADDGRRGLYPDEPENCRRDLRAFLPIWGHLALMLAVMKVYRVEGRGLFLLTSIALAALPVHYLLAHRWKKPFFLAISVVGLFVVFGVEAASMVTALALALIGVCRLPIAWSSRAAIVATAGLGLGLARGWSGTAGGEFAGVVLPVLGSMLMFRMILYLYEIKHAERPEPVVDTLGYFFLLPNWCFLHFPVVDYRTLNRGHFAAEVHETQRTGLRMIFRGVVHLLAYRLVYHELLISPDEVHSPATLAGYVACNYLLYLQVSGQFHVACGMLHLFGYKLPETHHNYLLATGFTDYWRRINIYWKDFMIRVVFNPVAFRLKRRPGWVTLTAATSAVFVATWILHAYQKFWRRGTWGFSVPDALFWGILGLLVMVNVQLDARAKPKKPAAPSVAGFAVRSAKTAATFLTIALLWSLWCSPSVGAWTAMFRRAFGG